MLHLSNDLHHEISRKRKIHETIQIILIEQSIQLNLTTILDDTIDHIHILFCGNILVTTVHHELIETLFNSYKSLIPQYFIVIILPVRVFHSHIVDESENIIERTKLDIVAQESLKAQNSRTDKRSTSRGYCRSNIQIEQEGQIQTDYAIDRFFT